MSRVPNCKRSDAVRTIGVISDTHGLLRPEALAALEGSDLILHAGDVGDLSFLEQLGRIAPVHAVYGNTDWGDVRNALRDDVVVDLGADDGVLDPSGPEGPVAYMLHDLADLALDPVGGGFGLVVAGHTHEPEITERGGVMYLNPGSAGPRRFRLPVSVARIELTDGRMRARIVELDVGE
jgi:putative phosphoesterase